MVWFLRWHSLRPSLSRCNYQSFVCDILPLHKVYTMLGSSFRRKRNLIFKIIVGIPVLWFSIIGFTVVISGNGPFPDGGNNHVVDPRDSDVANSPEFQPTQKPNPKFWGHNLQESDPQEDEYDRKVREEMLKLKLKTNSESNKPHQVPNLDIPNPDHERLIEKIKADAENDLRRKEEERRRERMREDGDLKINPGIKRKPSERKVDTNAPGMCSNLCYLYTT